jgi:hypothetical protein
MRTAMVYPLRSAEWKARALQPGAFGKPPDRTDTYVEVFDCAALSWYDKR